MYINQCKFYFRSEVQVVSEEGLNAYGAVTWGQFFVYQGFNEHCGWMHTSSEVDVADLYVEKVSKKIINGYMNTTIHKNNDTKKILLRYSNSNAVKSKTLLRSPLITGP